MKRVIFLTVILCMISLSGLLALNTDSFLDNCKTCKSKYYPYDFETRAQYGEYPFRIDTSKYKNQPIGNIINDLNQQYQSVSLSYNIDLEFPTNEDFKFPDHICITYKESDTSIITLNIYLAEPLNLNDSVQAYKDLLLRKEYRAQLIKYDGIKFFIMGLKYIAVC